MPVSGLRLWMASAAGSRRSTFAQRMGYCPMEWPTRMFLLWPPATAGFWLDRYTRRHENFVLVRSNRAITVAARNRRLALVTNILSRDSDGAVPVAARDIKGAALASLENIP